MNTIKLIESHLKSPLPKLHENDVPVGEGGYEQSGGPAPRQVKIFMVKVNAPNRVPLTDIVSIPEPVNHFPSLDELSRGTRVPVSYPANFRKAVKFLAEQGVVVTNMNTLGSVG